MTKTLQSQSISKGSQGDSAEERPHLPNCLFIGPQKAGTSWVYEYLKSRRDICLPKGVKETFFFDDRFERKGLAWYSSHFSHRSEHHRYVIEVAPTYFQSAFATQRILETLGVIPIIVTLREPVARTFSLYNHMKRYGFTNLPLRDACQQVPELLDSSNYVKHIQRWHQMFGRENVHVLLHEDMSCDIKSYLDSINMKLGLTLDGVDFDVNRRVNDAAASTSVGIARTARMFGDFLRDKRLYWPIEFAKSLGLKRLVYGRPRGKAHAPLANDDYTWLHEKLSPQIDELESLLSMDLSAWKSELISDAGKASFRDDK